MLTLLLSNRLAALFLLLASLGSLRRAAPASPPGASFLTGVALAAWATVFAGILPAFQVAFRLPEDHLIAFDSRIPIGWFLVLVCLFALVRQCSCGSPSSGSRPGTAAGRESGTGPENGPANAPGTGPTTETMMVTPSSLEDWRLSLAGLIAALIADPRFPLSGFLLGGIHRFQPWEGFAGLVFLLYPILAFSGRMGSVGAGLGSGLFSLGFGAIPAVMLAVAIQGARGMVRPGSLLGAAALSCVLLSGLEGLGQLDRSWSATLATISFIVLQQFDSRRSTEVRAS